MNKSNLAHARTMNETPAAVAHRIQGYLQAKDDAAAADLAFMNIDNALENPRLAQMCLLAFARAGDLVHAVDLAEALMKQDMLPDTAFQVAQTMLTAGRSDDALAVGRKALERQEGKSAPRLRFIVAQALLASGGSADEALIHLEKAHQEFPDNVPMLRLYGDLLLQAGRYDDAVDILGCAAVKAPRLANVQLLYARALKHARRYDEASNIMLAVSRLDPTSRVSKRMATGALLQAGKEDDARALYQELVGDRQQKLKSTFRQELDSLETRLDEVKIPQSRLDWAWRITSRALGHEPSPDRAEWERKARWGQISDLAIMDWLECRSEAMTEVSDLLEGHDMVRKVTAEVLAEGKGALLATAHIGPLFAGPLMLHQVGAPTRWLSSTPRISTTTYADSLISTSDLTETQVARRIKESLQTGHLVIVACDGAMSPVAPRVEWENASVTYSDFSAIMAYRSGIPCLFATAYWKDERIDFVLERLPVPGEGETLREFTLRWRNAYFAQITRHFTRGPENLRLAGGIWRHV